MIHRRMTKYTLEHRMQIKVDIQGSCVAHIATGLPPDSFEPEEELPEPMKVVDAEEGMVDQPASGCNMAEVDVEFPSPMPRRWRISTPS
ncbi:hypothetical protein D1007_14678 [Hordeum vulgare]|nr:hypothetical protein D1007_14678 [Hordeum vulgare]